MVSIPLFLLTLIECYQEKNEIPNNRSQIYEYLIDKRLRCEEEKSLAPHPRMLTHGKTALISLAVGLQLMDRNSMTEDEMFEDVRQCLEELGGGHADIWDEETDQLYAEIEV